jgi:hypothetical protein
MTGSLLTVAGVPSPVSGHPPHKLLIKTRLRFTINNPIDSYTFRVIISSLWPVQNKVSRFSVLFFKPLPGYSAGCIEPEALRASWP